MGYTFL